MCVCECTRDGALVVHCQDVVATNGKTRIGGGGEGGTYLREIDI